MESGQATRLVSHECCWEIGNRQHTCIMLMTFVELLHAGRSVCAMECPSPVCWGHSLYIAFPDMALATSIPTIGWSNEERLTIPPAFFVEGAGSIQVTASACPSSINVSLMDDSYN